MILLVLQKKIISLEVNGLNPIQFRNNLINSLTSPNDKSYEIEAKKIKIYHPTTNLRLLCKY